MEDYLRSIYMLQQQTESVTTSALSEQLGGLKAGSVTGMIKRLAELGLVTHTPYYGVRLTLQGEQIALEVIRHHRLIELFLVQKLGYTWDEVHEEADALEHVISERLEARIAEQLGNPTFDPHGDPIPALDGTLPGSSALCLSDLPIGTTGRIVRVAEQHPDLLRYIAGLGLKPGAELSIVDSAPFDGPLSIKIDHATYPLDRRLARMIFVEHL
jgi:DtxR family Mn-dependent transcriptional regulator